MNAHRQQGAILVTGMLILVVLTLIGITGMTNTSMQERMAGHDRDRQIAFQAAEAALREGELFVTNNLLTAGNFTSTCTSGLCTPIATGTNEQWLISAVWSDPTRHFVHNMSTASVSEIKTQPKFIIEDLGKKIIESETVITCAATPSPCPNMYRITAVGTGATDTARVMLQVIWQKDP